MDRRIKVTSPNGGSTIEIYESELKRFTDQGFKRADEKPAGKTSTKASEVKKDGDVQG